MVDIITELLISEKEMTDTYYERLKKALSYIENTLIDSDGNMFLTVESLMKENNIIAGSNDIV